MLFLIHLKIENIQNRDTTVLYRNKLLILWTVTPLIIIIIMIFFFQT